MSFLSLLSLSIAECRHLRLTDDYSLHRVVLDHFPRDGEKSGDRILYADKGMRNGRHDLLILSDRPPVPDENGELRVKAIPQSFLQYPAYHFELVVNAVRRHHAEYMPLKTPAAVEEWFTESAPKWGFNVAVLETRKIWKSRFRKKGAFGVAFNKAHLYGGLIVADREKFMAAFHGGIGRGKAFGCGLLQLRPHIEY